MAEKLDANFFLNNSYNIEMELALTRLNESMRKLTLFMSRGKKIASELTSEWQQFKKLAKDLLDVSSEINAKLNYPGPTGAVSSMERLREHYEHVNVSISLSTSALSSVGC